MVVANSEPVQSTNAAPTNSKTDRSFEDMLREVKSQKTVQAGIETLLIGIGTIVKEGRLDSSDLDRALNKYTKVAFEAVIFGTPAQLTHDTTGKGPEEVTGDTGSYYDPQRTPGQIPGEGDAKPLDMPDLDKPKGDKKHK